MQRFKIGVDGKNLQVAMNPGSDGKPTNSFTYDNLEIGVSSAVLEVFVREQNPTVKENAKRILEGYVSKMKNALEDETIRPKLKPAFKDKIEEAIKHSNGWLEYVKNPQADDNEINKYLERNQQEIYDLVIEEIKKLKQSSSST